MTNDIFPPARKTLLEGERTGPKHSVPRLRVRRMSWSRLSRQLSLASCGKSQGTMFFPRSRFPLSAQPKQTFRPDSPIAEPPTVQPLFLPSLSFPRTPALMDNVLKPDSDEVPWKGAVSGDGAAIKGFGATEKLHRIGDAFACRARWWGVLSRRPGDVQCMSPCWCHVSIDRLKRATPIIQYSTPAHPRILCRRVVQS